METLCTLRDVVGHSSAALVRLGLGLDCIALRGQNELECHLLSALESRIVREARAQSQIGRSTASSRVKLRPAALPH